MTALARASSFALPSEFATHALALISHAQSELLLLDPGWENMARLGRPFDTALEHFLRRHESTALKIMLRDPEYLTRHTPRLAQLLTRYAHRMESRQPAHEYARFPETLIIADASSALRKPESRQLRGMVRWLDADYAQIHRTRFLEVWQHAEPGFRPTVLGL